MIICFRDALPQEKKNRQATKGIDSRRLNESNTTHAKKKLGNERGWEEKGVNCRGQRGGLWEEKVRDGEEREKLGNGWGEGGLKGRGGGGNRRTEGRQIRGSGMGSS